MSTRSVADLGVRRPVRPKSLSVIPYLIINIPMSRAVLDLQLKIFFSVPNMLALLAYLDKSFVPFFQRFSTLARFTK